MTATASAITPVSRRRGGGMSDVRFALIIVGGVIAFHAIVVLVPLVYSLWLSFHETNVILRKVEFIGGGNYADLLTRPEIGRALVTTLVFTSVAVILSLVFGLLIALVLNETFRGRGLLRGLVLLPWAISEVVTASIFRFLVNPSFGVLTGVLEPFGLASSGSNWMSQDFAIFWVALAFV